MKEWPKLLVGISVARTTDYSLIITLPVPSYYKTWGQMKYTLVALSILLGGDFSKTEWQITEKCSYDWFIWHTCDI